MNLPPPSPALLNEMSLRSLDAEYTLWQIQWEFRLGLAWQRKLKQNVPTSTCCFLSWLLTDSAVI